MNERLKTKLMFLGMSNYSESEGRSVRLPLKLYLVIFLDHCGFLIILFENVTCLSLGDNVSGFAFACGYATDSSREKKYVPRTLSFQRILLRKAENNNLLSLRRLRNINLTEG